MDELLEEFWEWFFDEFKHKNPDTTSHYDYEHLFKTFWEEKGYDVWKYEIKDKCYDKHCEYYEPDDYDYVDAAYDMEVGK